jgi:hypothetical protein
MEVRGNLRMEGVSHFPNTVIKSGLEPKTGLNRREPDHDFSRGTPTERLSSIRFGPLRFGLFVS